MAFGDIRERAPLNESTEQSFGARTLLVSEGHLLERRPYPSGLSVVIPCYNEEAMVPILEREISTFLRTLQCPAEVILVNDGSTDRTLERLVAWASRDARIAVLQLSRNFGHQAAASAGLEFARHQTVVLLDADLQDPLAIIHEMIDRYQAGFDVVYGQRIARAGETRFKRFTAWMFYRLMRALVDKRLPVDTGDFRLISRECLNDLLKLRECHRFLRGMVTWVGYPQTAVPYQRNPRAAGETKYPFHKMMRFAWTAATSFSTVPLNLSFVLGGLAGLFACEEVVRAIITAYEGRNLPGWTSLMVVTSAIGSAILFLLGVLGQYIGQIFEQAKDRPLYVISRVYDQEALERLMASGNSKIPNVNSHSSNK